MRFCVVVEFDSIAALSQEFGFKLTRSIGRITWFLDVLNLCGSQTWTEFRNGSENGHITYDLVVNSTFSYRHRKQFSSQDMREVTDLIHRLRSWELLGTRAI